MTSYLVYGLMRSGNHAIIEWIAGHFQRVAHHNDITRLTPHGYVEYGDSKTPIDCAIFSTETVIPFSPVEARLRRSISLPPEARPIGILRDYYNAQASLIRFGQTYPWARHMYKEHKRLWPQFALSYLARPHDFIVFNWWVEQLEYQQGVETAFGWPRVDRVRTVPNSGIGKGSSFESPGELSHQQLNARWRSMPAGDAAWEDAVDCPAAKELNERIFGWSL
jgi:hypothetical protein